MSKLQRIEEMEKQLAALRAEVEQESKVTKWEPKAGEYYVALSGNVDKWATDNGSRLFGLERQTREVAERTRDRMRVFNRLLAYVDEFAPGYDPESDNERYAICIDNGNPKPWSYSKGLDVIGAVLMPKSVAEELCLKLNSGEVVL